MESEVRLPLTNSLESLPPESSNSAKQILIVCRGRSCRKYDCDRVFANFQQNLPPNVELISVPCLGECGNGPMVLVKSDSVWYSEVHPDEVAQIIQQHLIEKRPVKAMLYPKFHSQ